MRARRLNRRLVLEAAARVPDGAGGYAERWEARGTLWAEVAAGAGREVGVDLIARERVSLRIMVRGAPVGAPSRPVAGQRFREGARIYPILAVAEADPEGRYLVCHAEEGGRG
jgi:head-tail adaptor